MGVFERRAERMIQHWLIKEQGLGSTLFSSLTEEEEILGKVYCRVWVEAKSEAGRRKTKWLSW